MTNSVVSQDSADLPPLLNEELSSTYKLQASIFCDNISRPDTNPEEERGSESLDIWGTYSCKATLAIRCGQEQ